MKLASPLRILLMLSLLGASAPVLAGKIKAGASAFSLAQNAATSQPAGVEKGRELAALEKKLLGSWKGGPCVGDYSFDADGTFELHHFTPGNNTVTGDWSIRWDALPPTLVLTCKTSDFKKKTPSRQEYQYLGKDLELKLLELNSEALVCRSPNDKGDTRYERRAEK